MALPQRLVKELFGRPMKTFGRKFFVLLEMSGFSA